MMSEAALHTTGTLEHVNGLIGTRTGHLGGQVAHQSSVSWLRAPGSS
jgi:hypothetical protein